MGEGTKKLKIVGNETYFNAVTGELHEMQVVEVDERDAHFQKLWVGNILAAVDELSSKKLKIVLWLVQESAKHRNIIPMTVRQMATTLNVSTATLTRTLKVLEEHDIIRRETGRVWMNPSVVYKGGMNGRLEVLTRYRAISRPEQTENAPEEEAHRLKEEETRLLKRLEVLRAKRRGLTSVDESEAAAE